MLKERKLKVWTDGACKGNPGPGGWGAYLVWGEKALELCGGEMQTTNNQMELTAVIEALSAIKRPVPMVVSLDSQYVKNGILEWMPQWKSRGWKTAAGSQLKMLSCGSGSMSWSLATTLNGSGLKATRENPVTKRPMN